MRALTYFLLLFPTCVNALLENNNNDTCISELYDIQQTEAALAPQLVGLVRIYTLCPFTTYQIADSFDSQRQPRQGRQSPLVLGRPNMHIRCGSDGSSANQCVLSGGHLQVHLSHEYYYTTAASSTSAALHPDNKHLHPIANTVLEGITFTAADSFNVLAEFPGDLTLRDCVFRDNHAISLVLAHILLKYQQDQSLRQRHRGLDVISKEPLPASTAADLKVVFVDCLFVVRSFWFEQCAGMQSVYIAKSALTPFDFFFGIKKQQHKRTIRFGPTRAYRWMAC